MDMNGSQYHLPSYDQNTREYPGRVERNDNFMPKRYSVGDHPGLSPPHPSLSTSRSYSSLSSAYSSYMSSATPTNETSTTYPESSQRSLTRPSLLTRGNDHYVYQGGGMPSPMSNTPLQDHTRPDTRYASYRPITETLPGPSGIHNRQYHPTQPDETFYAEGISESFSMHRLGRRPEEQDDDDEGPPNEELPYISAMSNEARRFPLPQRELPRMSSLDDFGPRRLQMLSTTSSYESQSPVRQSISVMQARAESYEMDLPGRIPGGMPFGSTVSSHYTNHSGQRSSSIPMSNKPPSGLHPRNMDPTWSRRGLDVMSSTSVEDTNFLPPLAESGRSQVPLSSVPQPRRNSTIPDGAASTQSPTVYLASSSDGPLSRLHTSTSLQTLSSQSSTHSASPLPTEYSSPRPLEDSQDGSSRLAQSATPPAGSSKAADNPPPKKKKKSKMHECDVCGKKFPRPSGLRTHMNTHNNAKPYLCAFPGCSRAFGVRSNAKRHLRTHGVLPQSAVPSDQYVVGFNPPLVSPQNSEALDATTRVLPSEVSQHQERAGGRGSGGQLAEGTGFVSDEEPNLQIDHQPTRRPFHLRWMPPTGTTKAEFDDAHGFTEDEELGHGPSHQMANDEDGVQDDDSEYDDAYQG